MIKTKVTRSKIPEVYLNYDSPSGTASGIFNALDKWITTFKIPWENCTAVGVNNTDINMGNRHH